MCGHFNAPPGLQPDERVWLVVEPQRSEARVMMSEETLGTVAAEGPPQRFDITHRLESAQSAGDFRGSSGGRWMEQNTADGGSDRLPGGLVGEVRLEIEEVR